MEVKTRVVVTSMAVEMRKAVGTVVSLATARELKKDRPFDEGEAAHTYLMNGRTYSPQGFVDRNKDM